jgi:hypothetical protein
MPVGIAGARRRDRQPRADDVDERLGRRGPAAVVGDLEEVDRSEAAGEQLGIDLLLDVAHEEESTMSDLAREDNRDVVDARSAIGRIGGNTTLKRPQDAEFDLVDREPIASCHGQADRAGRRRHAREPRGISGTRPSHPGLHHPHHLVALEQQREPGHVVLVRVGQNHRVDAPVPRRDAPIQRNEQPIGVGAAVDQEACSPRSFDQDGVALTDIEDAHAGDSPGAARDDATGDDDGDDQGNHGRPADQSTVGLRGAVSATADTTAATTPGSPGFQIGRRVVR